ncbi:hypothetical protein LVJ94_40765 [Pendulispora rubella]|uniref:Uncharacterized protein n=1 Tax=Pendulispora rubella TaxID=2741070 RepID=A0ABZ2LIQ4_9BACT
MSKAPSPLLGYNNNVRHKSRVFHIQTEDSGVRHPHIITHLFMDGGRILKSVKKSYSEHLGTEGLADVVRQMMKEQHKAMFIALRGGHFDHLVDAAADSSPPSLRPQSAKPAAAEPPPKADSDAPVSPPAAASPPPLPSPVLSPPPAAPPVSAPAPETPPASTTPETREQPERETELTLDIDALEPPPPEVRLEPPPPPPEPLPRPARVESPPPPEPLRDLSPQLFKKRADTFRFRQGKETRATEALLSTTLPKASPPGSGPPKAPLSGAAAAAPKMPLPGPALPKAPSPAPSSPKVPLSSPGSPKAPDPLRDRLPAFLRGDVPPSSGGGPISSGVSSSVPDTDRVPPSSQPSKVALPPAAAGSEGRYAPARPAAIFGHARPQQGSSIFGEDLISDKSLDEVILSYLAEDLEADKK